MTIEIEGVKYFTASEVQEMLGIARQTLWRWRKAFAVPQGRLFRGHQILFSSEEFEQIRGFSDRLEKISPQTSRLKKKRGDLG